MSNDAKPWRRFDIDGGRTVKMPSGDYTDYAEAKATVDTLAARIAELEAQLEAARKDGERLDVLLRAITPTGQLVCGCYDPDDGDCDWSFIDLHGTPLIGHYDTPREAIDALAALEATTPENRK